MTLKQCKRCKSDESRGAVFRTTTLPDGNGGKVSFQRGVCWECEKTQRRQRDQEVKKEKARRTEVKRWLIVPDCHVPYHDEKAFGIMLRAAEKFKPDGILLLGDFADFYAVSSHSKSPARIQNLKWEAGEVQKALHQLQLLGAKEHVYLLGNHEDRLQRYICDRAPELFGSINIEEVLGAQQWKIVPYKTTYKLGKLSVTHDTGNAGINAHRQAAVAYRGSAVIGHTHRMSYEVLGAVDGAPHLAFMCGWLGDFSKIDYLHSAKAAAWAHGFAVALELADGLVHVQPCPILGGKVFVAGVLTS